MTMNHGIREYYLKQNTLITIIELLYFVYDYFYELTDQCRGKYDVLTFIQALAPNAPPQKKVEEENYFNRPTSINHCDFFPATFRITV